VGGAGKIVYSTTLQVPRPGCGRYQLFVAVIADCPQGTGVASISRSSSADPGV
jgi:hypothetical protein